MARRYGVAVGRQYMSTAKGQKGQEEMHAVRALAEDDVRCADDRRRSRVDGCFILDHPSGTPGHRRPTSIASSKANTYPSAVPPVTHPHHRSSILKRLAKKPPLTEPMLTPCPPPLAIPRNAKSVKARASSRPRRRLALNLRVLR